MSAGPARLSVVVGTMDRLDQLKICVETVIAQTKTPLHLYITDAGSTDGTVEWLESVASDVVRPVLVGKRLGQAKALNDVFRTIETPWVAWLSDDNEVVAGGLDRAVGVLEADARIGMVALKVKDQLGPFTAAPYIGGLSRLGILNVNQGVLPTPLLKRLGGFSEVFRDYGIDPDLTAKVLFAGLDVVYLREIAILHSRSWSMDKGSPAWVAHKAKTERSLELYAQKYGPMVEPSAVWNLKKRAWQGIRKLLGNRYDANAARPVLGLLARDWLNLFNGRYLSLLDPLLCAGKPYHLRQRAAARPLPADLVAPPL